jgi:hypothetical protein
LLWSGDRSVIEDVTVAKCSHEPADTTLPELIQLQKKLQSALSPKRGVTSSPMGLPQMIKAASITSLSTMCPASEDECDNPHGLEAEDEDDVQFDMNVEEFPLRSTAEATGINVRSPLRTKSQLICKVPRDTDLAAEFEVSDSANAPKTTIMIRNIPNRYNQRDLVLELEEMGLTDSFDFVYLPIDRSTRATLGYAFVNFVNSTWANKCMNDFQGYRFKKYRGVANKLAAVSVAYLQGLEKNLAHYENKVVNSSKIKQGRPLVLLKTSTHTLG